MPKTTQAKPSKRKAKKEKVEFIHPTDLPAESIYIGSPEEFATKTLGIESWPKLQEIFHAIESGKRKILVRSCNGAGKTTALAALCLWKLKCFNDSIVLTTASSWTQVSRSLWGEIRKLARQGQVFEESAITTTQIKLDDKHYAVGISPSQPENAQGFHAPSMLIAIDEATGVDREIIDALWGNATSKDAQMVLIYNPINASSFPFEAEESGDWQIITISAFEHPNVIEGWEKIPGAVTREWIDDRLDAWSYEVETPSSLDDPQFLFIPWQAKWYKKTERIATRICGEWPLDGGESFIEPLLVDRSLRVEPVAGTRAIGVDVARSGNDRTVFAFFEGNAQLPFESYYGRDLMRTANRIAELYHEGWHTIAIDDTGVGGGVTDRLRELNIPVHAVNFAQSAKGFIRFKNLANARAEMYFVLEEEIRSGAVKLTNDKQLHQELIVATLKTSATGAYMLEEKEALTKRLGRSPDKADATALARYGLRLDILSRRLKFS